MKDNAPGSDFDQPAFYNGLYEAKTDIELNLGLGLQGILKKDFKKYHVGGVYFAASSGSVPVQRMRETFTIVGLANGIKEAQTRVGGDIYAIITSFKDENKEAKRDLLLYTDDDMAEKNFFLQFSTHMEKNEKFKLNDKKSCSVQGATISTYNVGNPKMSRKNLEAEIVAFYNSVTEQTN